MAELVINGEKYIYIETGEVPSCIGCKYLWNYPQLPPCSECQGCNKTGKSFYTAA